MRDCTVSGGISDDSTICTSSSKLDELLMEFGDANALDARRATCVMLTAVATAFSRCVCALNLATSNFFVSDSCDAMSE